MTGHSIAYICSQREKKKKRARRNFVFSLLSTFFEFTRGVRGCEEYNMPSRDTRTKQRHKDKAKDQGVGGLFILFVSNSLTFYLFHTLFIEIACSVVVRSTTLDTSRLLNNQDTYTKRVSSSSFSP